MAVRITQGTTNRTYLKNLNGSQHAMNKAMERVESGRDFTKVSENLTGGTRAIEVRARLYRNEQMTDNVNTAAEQLNIAESSLKEMNDICSNVTSEMFKALNTPTLQAGKETFIAFLDGAKDEIMRLANTKYNNKYVLGGQRVDKSPFEADSEGKMFFNGCAMDELELNTDPQRAAMYKSGGTDVEYSGESYMDIGLDIDVKNNKWVNPKTAFRVTVDGVDALGYGKTEVSYDEILGIKSQAGAGGSGTGSGKTETVSNNIYDMMTEMQKAIRDSDNDINAAVDKLSAIMVNFKKQSEKIISSEAEIGVRSKFLETNLDRLENEHTSLLKMQKDIEGVDDATEITNFLGYQNAWNLVMQFGKNIVPKSLMDYVN